MTMELALSKGYVATIDDADAHLARFKWFAVTPYPGLVYAVRRRPKDEIAASPGSPKISLHRQLLGVLGSVQVDHINGDTLDNRRDNLRLASSTENGSNRSLNRNSTSGYKGVTWVKARGNWRANIKVNGKPISLGVYDDPVEAARAYDKAAIELHGAFAKPNFPDKV
jgi:hypothetical protein